MHAYASDIAKSHITKYSDENTAHKATHTFLNFFILEIGTPQGIHDFRI
jgi:hypothetical protein